MDKISRKSFQNASVIWKAVILSFPLIGKWLVWKVGAGNRVRLGNDPWVGSFDREMASLEGRSK